MAVQVRDAGLLRLNGPQSSRFSKQPNRFARFKNPSVRAECSLKHSPDINDNTHKKGWKNMLHEKTGVQFLYITPDGQVTELAGTDILKVAHNLFTSTEVVPCVEYHGEIMVGVIEGFGRLDGLPINEKAWALYGRSPIFGPMLFGVDLTEDEGRVDPIPQPLAALLLGDTDWVGEELRTRMRGVLATINREEGSTWHLNSAGH